MAFSVKAWLDRFGSGGSYDQPTDTGDTPDTPVDAAGLRNMETRLSAYTDSTVTAHTGDTSAAHAASAISFTPTGTIAATDAQAAVAEAASEAASNLTTGLAGKADLTGGHVPVAQLGSGTPASGKYVDGASGAWLSLPAQSGSGDTIGTARGSVSVGARGGIYRQGSLPVHYGGTTTHHKMPVCGPAGMRGDLAEIDYGNWYYGGYDTPPNDLTVKCAVVDEANAIWPAFANGSRSVTLAPQAPARFLAPSLELRAGDNVWVRTFYRAPAEFETTLGAAITNTAATTITTAAAAPAALQGTDFYIRIDDEILFVTAGETGTSWTVARGLFSTAAATHSNGAGVGMGAAPIDWASDTGTLSWMQAGDHLADNPASGPDLASIAYAPQQFFYSPVALRVRWITPADIDALVMLGDSNTATTDRRSAWEQVVGDDYPFTRATVPGSSTIGFSTKPGPALLAMEGATILGLHEGTNELSDDPDDTMAGYQAWIDRAATAGLVAVIVDTIPPAEDDNTDAPQVDPIESNRVEINTRLRAEELTHASVAIVIADVASSVESNSSRADLVIDGGYWLADGDGPVGSSVHYHQAGQDLAAVVWADAWAMALARTSGVAAASTTPAAPVNTVAPAVTGSAVVGSTLTRTLGSWTGAPAPTKTTKWQREGATNVWADISGATASTYVPVSADIGHRLRPLVTATNGSGTVSAAATPTSAVVDAPTVLDPLMLSPDALWESENLSAGALASWTDLSGNSRHLAQGTSANRPTVVAAATPTGLPVVRFDKTTSPDSMRVTSGWNSSTAPPAEVFIVSKHRNGPRSDSDTLFFATDDGSTLQAKWTASGGSTAQVKFGASTNLFSSSTDDPSTGFHVWHFVFNGASSSLTKDGTAVVSGDAGSGGSGLLSNFLLGTIQDGASNATDIDVAAAFVKSGTLLASGDVTSLIDYFLTKYVTP